MGRGTGAEQGANVLYERPVPRGDKSELSDFDPKKISPNNGMIIYCSEAEHYPDRGLVYVRDPKKAIVVDEFGQSVGYWEDWSSGIPAYLEEEANKSETVYCLEHSAAPCLWHEPKTA